MAFGSQILTSIYGRRLGLQTMSSAQTGGSKGAKDYLVGPAEFRAAVTTAETTSANVESHGTSYLPGTSAASSAVYTLDPPIPGVSKRVLFDSSNGPIYLKTANSETFLTTVGSTHTTIKASSFGGSISLIGITTAIWGLMGVTSGTSSQASGFGLTTST